MRLLPIAVRTQKHRELDHPSLLPFKLPTIWSSSLVRQQVFIRFVRSDSRGLPFISFNLGCASVCQCHSFSILSSEHFSQLASNI